jgi:hypothetical protein
MTSSTSGSTVLENNSNGQIASHTFSNQTEGSLCGQNGEWIVEAPIADPPAWDFADFGTVTFTGASAIVGGVLNLYIDSNGQAVTSTTIDGDNVTITYIYQ